MRKIGGKAAKSTKGCDRMPMPHGWRQIAAVAAIALLLLVCAYKDELSGRLGWTAPGNEVEVSADSQVPITRFSGEDVKKVAQELVDCLAVSPPRLKRAKEIAPDGGAVSLRGYQFAGVCEAVQHCLAVPWQGHDRVGDGGWSVLVDESTFSSEDQEGYTPITFSFRQSDGLFVTPYSGIHWVVQDGKLVADGIRE